MLAADIEMVESALAGNDVDQLNRARIRCQAAVAREPGSAHAMFLMGSVEFRLGRADRGSGWISKVLAIKQDSPQLYRLYAEMLAAQERHGEAIAAFLQAIALRPNYAEAYFGLADALGKTGDEAGAIDAYRRSLAVDPAYPEALNNLGFTLEKNGAMAEAADCFTRAIAVRPDYPFALNNLGKLRLSQGALNEAENLFRRALARMPDYADALNNLGSALYQGGKFSESGALYRKALALRPDYPNALSNLGLILHEEGCFAESIPLFNRALALQPDHADALNNLGITFLHLGEFEKSITCFEKALAVQPRHPDALNNLGNGLRALGDLPGAIAFFQEATASRSDDPKFLNNLAMALLEAGRFDEGWRAYECRWRTPALAGALGDTKKPIWRGEPGDGRTLLIRSEQGFGDTIQFCRYAPLASTRGFHVVLEAQPALVRLMKSLTGVDQVISQGAPLPDFDFYCPTMSLPAAFNTRVETIPAPIPYLAAPDEIVAAWRERLTAASGNERKVGVAWAGSPRFNIPDLIAVDRRRSMAPELLAPVIANPGIRFFSLQKGGRPAPKEFGLINLIDECRDFADTAGLIANLDLVISVDTAVAHLAGALGKPVWILDRFDSCWRWMKPREESPWYPTMRLFRQPKPGDWASVVQRVGKELSRS